MLEFGIRPNCVENFCLRPERVFFHLPEQVILTPNISFWNFRINCFKTKIEAVLKL